MKKELEIRGTPSLILPVFCDMVQISASIKESKDKKQRNGHIRLSFLDMARHQVMSEIVMDHIHAKDFLTVLEKNIKTLEQAIKKGKLPGDKKTTKTSKSNDHKNSYIS